jgi:hypothetical protein
MSTMLAVDAAPVPQHMLALQRANRIRLARAQLKRDVAGGVLTAGEMIRANPAVAANLEIAELLASQHRWGTDRTRNFLESIGLPETKPLGSFTERQRTMLAAMLA